MSADEPNEFDATDPEAREVASAAAADTEAFLSLMPHYYRGEVAQTGNRLSRLDLTIDWAIVVVTAVLALAFQSGDTAAYLLLIGLLGVTLFVVFDVRRYRTFDASRARVRVLEENLFATSLDPEGVPMTEWRSELSSDLRTPTFKVSYWEALSRRLRKVYYPLYLLLGVAWVFRVSLHAEPVGAGDGVGPRSGRGARRRHRRALFRRGHRRGVLAPRARRPRRVPR